MYEKTFLEDIAKQNFAKYKDRVTYTGPVPAQGDMVTVCCPEVASVSLNSVFLTEGSTEPEPASDDVVFSLPYNDIADQGELTGYYCVVGMPPSALMDAYHI